MAVPCSACGSLVRFRADLVEVRTELRAASDQTRLRTWRDRHLCRACAEVEWRLHDRGSVALRPMPVRPGDDPHRSWLGWLTTDQMAERLLAFVPGSEVVEDGRRSQWPPPGTAFVTAPDGSRTIRQVPGADVPRCAQCASTLATAATVEVRVEYRGAAPHLCRLRTWTEHHLCRACADALAAEHDRGAA